MARKPLGHAEKAHSEWARHLKPYGKQQVNGAQRRDGREEITRSLGELLIESLEQAVAYEEGEDTWDILEVHYHAS